MAKYEFKKTEYDRGLSQQLLEFINEIVDNDDGEVVWVNEAPQSTFPQTTLNVNLTKYKYVIVKSGNYSDGIVITNNTIVTKGDEKLSITNGSATTDSIMICNRFITIDGNNLVFSVCKKCYAGSTTQTGIQTDNGKLKPFAIIGYK